MYRWTFVCEDCHAGWQVDSAAYPTLLPGPACHCRWCGRTGKLRGVHAVVAVRSGQQVTAGEEVLRH
jgi:hypothetical protein